MANHAPAAFPPPAASFRRLRSLAGRLALVLLCLCLAACRRTESPTPAATLPGSPSPSPAVTAVTRPPAQTPTPRRTPAATPSLPPASQTPPPGLAGLRLRFWYVTWGSAQTDFQRLLDEFNRTNAWGLRLEATAYNDYGALGEAITAALNSQYPPDLVAGYPDQLVRWDKGGRLLLDLQPYLDDAAWGLDTAARQDFYPALWAQAVVTDTLRPGKRLALPWIRSATLLFYNQTWARQLGFTDPPRTASEFRAQACAAARLYQQDEEPANGGSGGWLVSPDTTPLVGWLLAFEAPLTRPEGGGYQLDTPEASHALAFLKSLASSGCVWYSSEVAPYADFAARRALFLTASLAGLESQQAALEAASSADLWTPLPFPAGGSTPVILLHGSSLAIFQSTPERQLAAWLLARWLAEPAQQARLAQSVALFPSRAEALKQMDSAMAGNPHWRAAAAWLPEAQVEPAYASWGALRGALNDALRQLLLPEFTADQIPVLLENLDQVAEEIHTQVR